MRDCSKKFGFFIEKTTFRKLKEICEQIHKELEVQYNDKKEKSDLTLI